MPERTTGEPDQFEQLIKIYCEERFGEPRPVETVWHKLALELNSPAPKAFTAEDETALTGSDDFDLPPEPEMAPTPLPIWRRRGPFSLVASLALLTVIALAVIGLILTTNQTQPNLNTAVPGGSSRSTAGAVPTGTPATTSGLDMNYPQSSQLKLDENDPWPTGKLEMDGKKITRKVALGTADNYSQVIKYYQQVLAKAGFKLAASETVPMNCDPTACYVPVAPTITSFAASNGSQHVGVMILSPQSWLPLSLSTYMHLGGQVKPTDTLIMLTFATDGVETATAGPVPTGLPANSDVVTDRGTITAAPVPTNAPANPDIVSEPAATTAGPAHPITPSAAGFPELDYPKSRPLTITDAISWPDGPLNMNGKKIVKKGVLATTDNYWPVNDFYQQQVIQAGFTITASYNLPKPCPTASCIAPFGSISEFAASKGSLHIAVIVVGPDSWNARAQYTFTYLGMQLQPAETMVLYTLATDN